MRYFASYRVGNEQGSDQSTMLNFDLPEGSDCRLNLILVVDKVARPLYSLALKVPPKPKPETKPCIICGDELESIFDTWDEMQPNGGGEIKINFDYGSEHDLTQIHGVICDSCGEGLA